MATDRTWRYYAALVASGVSVLGWLVAAGGVGYTAYVAATGGGVTRPLLLTVAALVVGIVFALAEKRLYRVDGRS